MKSWASYLVAIYSACSALQLGDAFNEDTQQARVGCFHHPENGGNIYSFEEEDLFLKRNISLSDYKDQQEPGANGTEIYNGVKYVRPGNNFEPNFTLFKKIDVNGVNEHPLFAYLKEVCPSTRNYFSSTENLFYHPKKNNDIRWNFEKFLITKSGKPYMRYDPRTSPYDIKADIQFLLMQDY